MAEVDPMLDEADAWISGCGLLRDLGTVVARGIVDDQEAHGGNVLCQDTLDAVPQVPAVVVVGNGDVDAGHDFLHSHEREDGTFARL